MFFYSKEHPLYIPQHLFDMAKAKGPGDEAAKYILDGVEDGSVRIFTDLRDGVPDERPTKALRNTRNDLGGASYPKTPGCHTD